MSMCPNCGTSMGCSCQRRVASNGAAVCANCITAYEQSIKTQPQQVTTEVLYVKAKLEPNKTS